LQQSCITAVIPSLYDDVNHNGEKWMVAAVNDEKTMCLLGKWEDKGWTTSGGLYLKDLTLWQD
jgi:hypothetical protein